MNTRRSNMPKPGCLPSRPTPVTQDPNMRQSNMRLHQYIETVVNDTTDLGVPRRLEHFDELSAKARAINHRIMEAQRVGQGSVLASPAFERIAHPSLEDGGGPRHYASATLGSKPWPAPSPTP